MLAAPVAAGLLTGLLAGLTGCGSVSGAEAPDSGVRGTVLLGPQCPVVTPDEPCPDLPAPGARLRVTRVGAQEPVATGRADAEGRFEVAVPPGDYEVSADAGMLCKPVPVSVEVGAFTRVDLSCDTGIR